MRNVQKFLSVLMVFGFMFAPKAQALINPNLPFNSAYGNLITRANTTSPLEGLGTVVNQTKNMIKCVYDVAVLGGAVGSINLVDDQGNACILPSGAVAVRDYLYVVTAPANGASLPYMSFQLLAANDLKTATAGMATGLIEGAATGSVTLGVGPTTSASSQVTVWNSAAITVGKVDLFIEFVYK
jgi:hypothetical protein